MSQAINCDPRITHIWVYLWFIAFEGYFSLNQCFFLDRCQLPVLFISNSSGIQYYNTKESTLHQWRVDGHVDALLAFDGVNKRLYLYTSGQGITSYNLDGSDPTTMDIDNVEYFTVDGRNNVIYYYYSLQDRLMMYNITSGEDVLIKDLENVISVKDLDMDTTNG